MARVYVYYTRFHFDAETEVGSVSTLSRKLQFCFPPAADGDKKRRIVLSRINLDAFFRKVDVNVK